MSRAVLVRLSRPEGYENVHPELLLEDAHINPAFTPELVRPNADEQLLDQALRALEGVLQVGAHAAIKPTDVTQTIIARLRKRLGKE